MGEWGSGQYSLEEVIEQTEERGKFFRKNKCIEQALYFERLSRWLMELSDFRSRGNKKYATSERRINGETN